MLRIEQYARDPAFQRIARSRESPDLDSPCLPAVFTRRLRSARRESGAKQYGLVDALLGIDVAPTCATGALTELRGDFARIDRRAAAQRAAGELAEMRALVNRLLYRTPLIACDRSPLSRRSFRTSGRPCRASVEEYACRR